MSKIFVYTTSTGGTNAMKNTERVWDILAGQPGVKPRLEKVLLDLPENGDKKQDVWAKSGKKGIYPLVFNGDTFVGAFEEIEEWNETGELVDKLQ